MQKISFIVLLGLISTLAVSQSDIFSKYYEESRKIAEGMSLDQLAGQMIQADFETITDMDKQITNPD